MDHTIREKVIRVFVSSTFSDFVRERTILNEEVFPKIAKRCRRRGFTLQIVDLQYGVPRKASNDNSTMDICLSEVKRCQKTGYYLNFVMLVGDRYGWNPTPVCIEESDCKTILKVAKSEYTNIEDRLREFYYLDENQVPTSYVLKTADDLRGEYRDDAEKVLQGFKDELEAIIADRSIRAKLNEADPKLIAKYFKSATEQEIQNGLLNLDDPEKLKHVICVFRTFTGMDEYVDIDYDKRKELRELRDTVERVYQKHGILDDDNRNLFLYEAINPTIYEISEKKEVSTLTKFTKDMEAALARVADISMDQYENSVQKPIAEAHEIFMRERIQVFEGRQSDVDRIVSFAFGKSDDSKKGVLVVPGERGLGKTSLMAKAASLIIDSKSKNEVIIRFIGATPESSNPYLFAKSILEEICERYGIECAKKESYRDIISELKNVYDLLPSKKPLILIVDAIDQLVCDGDEDRYGWLPKWPIANVQVIVSCMYYNEGESDIYEGLKKYLHYAAYHKINKIEREDARRAIESMLINGYKRRLTKDQYNIILDRYAQVERPIYFRFLTYIVKKWRSDSLYDQDDLGYKSTDQHLSPDEHISKIIRSYIDDIGGVHGRELVKYTLGLILASCDGMSENELIRLLADVPAVQEEYNWVYFQDPKENEKKNFLESKHILPYMVWSRLYYSLMFSLKTTRSNDNVLLDFYHLSMRDVAEIECDDIIEECHRCIAEFFDKEPESTDGSAPDEGTSMFYMDGDSALHFNPDYRRIREIPYQYRKLYEHISARGGSGLDEVSEKLAALLEKRDYIFANYDAGYIEKLMEELYYTVRLPQVDQNEAQRIYRSYITSAVARFFTDDGQDDTSFLEDIHNLLVFKKDDSVHVGLFSFGRNHSDEIYDAIQVSDANRRDYLTKLTALLCEMKLLNIHRRHARMDEAFAILDEIEDSEKISVLEGSDYYRNCNKSTRDLFSREKSRFYYDIAYMNYLTDNNGCSSLDGNKAIEYMDKSIAESVAISDEVGRYMSECVRCQIVMYNAIRENTDYLGVLRENEHILKKAEDVFAKNADTNRNAARWTINVQAHMVFVLYLMGDHKGVTGYCNKYDQNPWAKNPDLAESARRMDIYRGMSSENLDEKMVAANDMYDWVMTRINTVTGHGLDKSDAQKMIWNREFFIVDIFLLLKFIDDITAIAPEKKAEFKGRFEVIKDLVDCEISTMGNMYFADVVRNMLNDY